jgi:hypothetical protein
MIRLLIRHFAAIHPGKLATNEGSEHAKVCRVWAALRLGILLRSILIASMHRVQNLNLKAQRLKVRV